MKKKLLSKEVLVFDFGNASIMILHVDHAGPVPRIKNFASVPSARAHTAEDLKQLFREYVSSFDLSGRPEVIATWEEGMVFRQLVLPDLPAEDLKKAFWRHMQESYSFNEQDRLLSSECVLETERADGVKEKYFSVFYCERKAATEKLGLIEGLGFRVSVLIPAQAALAKLVEVFGEETDRDVLIFDIGYQKARVLVVRDGKNFFSRTVPLGGRTLTEAMVGSFVFNGQSFELDLDAAEDLKIAEGAQNPEVGHAGLAIPYMEKVAAEIKKSAEYYEGQAASRPISKVVFTGGGSNLKGLRPFMEKTLQTEVLFLELENYLMEHVADADKAFVLDNPGSFAATLGASLANIDGLNLVAKEVKHEKRQKVKKTSVWAAFSAAAVLLAFIISWTLFRIHGAESRLTATDAEWAAIQQTRVSLGAMETEGRLMRAALKGSVSPSALLKELSQITPSAAVLEEVQFDRRSQAFMIRGAVASSGKKGDIKVITQFVGSLLKSPFFKEATIVKTAEEDKKISFELHGTTAGRL